MIIESCQSGNWGFPGNFDGWDLIGLIFELVFWIGLIAGFALLVVWALRRAQIPAAPNPHAFGQPTADRQNTMGNQQSAEEILQAEYARGEITRAQYELRKQDIEKGKGSDRSKGESK